MKIRNPRTIRIAARLGALAVRGWIGTVRFQYQALGEVFHPRLRPQPTPLLFLFWHENILMPAFHFSHPGVHVLISQHADGELISQLANNLGYATVRGSTTRGGMEALRSLMKVSKTGNIVITPDGPRGPRRVIQSGAVYLASRSGMPVVSAGFGYSNAWRAGSWDRFALPRPLSKAYCVTLDPVYVPPKLDADELEHYRGVIQANMDLADRLAEEWALTGTPPRPSAIDPVTLPEPSATLKRAA